MTVTYEEPPPPPGPDSVRNIRDHKAKLTIYSDEQNDRFSINAFLDIENEEDFPLPCDEDVTVTLSIQDPDDPNELITLFTDTVPAGAASTCSAKYRAVLPPAPGAREVVIQQQTNTNVYVYLFAWRGTYLMEQRNDPNVPNIVTWVEDNIPAYQFTVQMGTRAWSGWSDNREGIDWRKEAPCIPLDVAPFGETKTELRCNR